MNKIERLERIELFLEGKLEGKELADFEEQLATDNTLVDEMENYRKASESIVLSSRNEIKMQLKHIHQEVIGQNYRRKLVIKNALRIAAVLAVTLIIALPSYFLYNNSVQNKSEKLFNQNFTPYMNISTQRGDITTKENILENAAMYFYNTREYDKAVINFEELLKTGKNDNQTLLFYYAITCLAATQNDKAIHVFSDLASDKNCIFKEQSEWYLSLAFIKANNKQKAIGILEKISKENGQYAIKAMNLLYELK